MSGAPDFFYREAQRLGYVARSAFKLLQIQKQHKLITPGSSVLDLGCAPGAWLQVACQSLGTYNNGGIVVGLDLKKTKVPSQHCDSRVTTICADVMNISKFDLTSLTPKKDGFNVVLSDMCPQVSGIATKDASLSIELGMRALHLAVEENNGILKSGGSLVVKLLESEDIKQFTSLCKPMFRKAVWLRPKATRSSSREIYLMCNDFKGFKCI